MLRNAKKNGRKWEPTERRTNLKRRKNDRKNERMNEYINEWKYAEKLLRWREEERSWLREVICLIDCELNRNESMKWNWMEEWIKLIESIEEVLGQESHANIM
jgi:hypothetical protein